MLTGAELDAMRICSECGVSIAGRDVAAITCSDGCRQKRRRRAAREQVSSPGPKNTTLIYFIQEAPDGAIKIGTTQELYKRLYALQTGNPNELVVRAAILGSVEDEFALHKRFAEGRLQGEWFDPDTPGLEALIRRLSVEELVGDGS